MQVNTQNSDTLVMLRQSEGTETESREIVGRIGTITLIIPTQSIILFRVTNSGTVIQSNHEE